MNLGIRNRRDVARDRAINLALKHLENARKNLDGFDMDWYDEDASTESRLIHQMQNRLRNIKYGRRIFTYDGN